MKFSVVIVYPKGYGHSAAFGGVSSSLAWALKDLSHDVIVAAEPAAGRRPIILGGNLLEHVSWTPPENAIIYNLEQMDGGSPWLTPHYLSVLREFEVWEYSETNARRYSTIGLPPPERIVPIGYAPTLEHVKQVPESRKGIDVCFYGSLNERRIAVLQDLRKTGMKIAIPNSYGWIRDDAIARSKIVLNMHYYESKVFEIVRVSHLLANRACVVSEGTGAEPDEAPFADAIAWSDYAGLVERCWALVTDEEERAKLSARGHAAMIMRPMTAFVRRALAGTAWKPPPDPKSAPRPLPSEEET